MKIQSSNIYINETFQPACLEIKDGKIINVELGVSTNIDMDYKNLRIVPGFIDIHCHGYNMLSVNKATTAGMTQWIKDLPNEGVTSFLASSSTAAEVDLLNSFKIISDLIKAPPSGANCLGIHVEGPQISFEYRGAQSPYYIQKPNIEQFNRYQEAANGNIKLICIAPEVDDELTLTKYCVANNVKVTIGHSGANYSQVLEAIEAGARSFTHTYNGMSQLGHRTPNVVGAALTSDNCYAELISDGIHVHPCACDILARCKGKDKLIITTDSVEIKGLKPGIYDRGTRTVEVFEDGSTRLANGTLAGSTNYLNKLVKTAIEDMKLDPITVFNAVTKNPAEFLGFSNKGTLAKGKDADIVILNSDYTINDVYIAGKQYIN